MGSDVSLSKAVRANLLSLQNTASMMDKTQMSVQPTAYAWSLPFIAAAGVLIGGRMRK